MTRVKRYGRRILGPVEPGRVVPVDACPQCGREITRKNNGHRRAHRDRNGEHCPGSGVPLASAPSGRVDLTEYPVEMPAERRYTAPTRTTTENPARVRVRSIRSSRGGIHPNSAFCSGCSRQIPLRNDGTLKAHRPLADQIVGPYCPGTPHVSPTSEATP